MDNLQENYEEFIKNNRLILKSQQKLFSEKHSVLTGEVSKTALSANSDKIVQ